MCGSKGQVEKKQILELLNLSEGRNIVTQHRYPLFAKREVLFDVFEESDFCEYTLCLSNFLITRENFQEKKKQLFQVAELCLNKMNSILFATGVYELTYYIIEDIRCIEEFNRNILLKFPFVFIKSENKYGLISTEQYNNTLCVVNMGEGVQDIFSDEDMGTISGNPKKK